MEIAANSNNIYNIVHNLFVLFVTGSESANRTSLRLRRTHMRKVFYTSKCY